MYPETATSWTTSSNSKPAAAGELGAVPGAASLLASTGAPNQGSPVTWRPRASASHLSRAANGIYYLRLAIPPHVRTLRPDLPQELRRSTKTTSKFHALQKAREMCAELITSLSSSASTMLVPSSSPSAPPTNGFVIELLNGALRSELYAGADAQTLSRYIQALRVVGQEIPASGTSALQASAAAADDGTSSEPPVVSIGAAGDTSLVPGSEAGAARTAATNAVGPHAGSGEGDGQQQAVADQASGDPPTVIWLWDAIQNWRANGAIRFAAHTWTYSYEPSFRIVRELLGTQRRDIALPDGSIMPNQLDVPLRRLDRTAIEKLGKLMQQMPARQGKRNDGVEAPALVAQAVTNKLPVQSPGNVAQRLRHLFPFIEHAAQKEWIAAPVLSEFKLLMKAADARAENAAAALGVHKPGAVSLNRDELKRTYETELYRNGAVERDWMHWCDPVRLYEGARVSEVAQLFTDDIIVVDGVPCFSFVNDTPLDGKEGDFAGLLSKAATLEEYRRLKNKASRRIIPVAPALIDLGFMDFVRERQEIVGRHPGLLFVGLRWQPKSGFGRRPSEHTLKLLKDADVWQHRRKVGHSLRASCSQELERVGMTGELLDRYLGHSTRTQRQRSYNEHDLGPAYPVQIALEFLRKLDFGVSFPTYAEIKQERAEWAREKQLARKNSAARRRDTGPSFSDRSAD